MTDRTALLARAAAGDPDARQAAAEILLRGLAVYLRCGGELDMARCCGLPPPAARRKLAQIERDHHLAAAYMLCIGPNRAEQLAHEIRDFQTRIAPAWSDLPAPPPHASQLRAALFRALRACPDGFPTSSRQLRRIVGSPATTYQDNRMKSAEIIEAEARHEFASSPRLQTEFRNDLAGYLAFRKAEAAGHINWMTRSAQAMSLPTGHDEPIATDGEDDGRRRIR